MWGAFSWHDLGPLNPLEGKVNTNKYTTILKDKLQPMVKQIYPDGIGLLWDILERRLSLRFPPPSTKHQIMEFIVK